MKACELSDRLSARVTSPVDSVLVNYLQVVDEVAFVSQRCRFQLYVSISERDKDFLRKPEQFCVFLI